MERPAPARIGSRYLIGDVLGRGSSGVVYRATVIGGDEVEGTTVAVKVLQGDVDDQRFLERFLRERSSLLGICHPNVVAIRDVVTEGETHAIVMDEVAGGDLRGYLRRHRLAPGQGFELLAQVAAGLAAVHAAGVLHCDLKPENVLLDFAPSGQPTARLTDFGIAGLVGTPAGGGGVLAVGTRPYMAPEVAHGQGPTTASDVFSLGVLGYELVSGRRPFPAGTPAGTLPRRPPGLGDPAWAVLASCLDLDPVKRPAAGDLAADATAVVPSLAGLEPLAVEAQDDGDDATTFSPSPGSVAFPRPRRPRRGTLTPVRAVAAAALVVALAATAAVATHGRSQEGARRSSTRTTNKGTPTTANLSGETTPSTPATSAAVDVDELAALDQRDADMTTTEPPPPSSDEVVPVAPTPAPTPTPQPSPQPAGEQPPPPLTYPLCVSGDFNVASTTGPSRILMRQRTCVEVVSAGSYQASLTISRVLNDGTERSVKATYRLELRDCQSQAMLKSSPPGSGTTTATVQSPRFSASTGTSTGAGLAYVKVDAVSLTTTGGTLVGLGLEQYSSAACR